MFLLSTFNLFGSLAVVARDATAEPGDETGTAVVGIFGITISSGYTLGVSSRCTMSDFTSMWGLGISFLPSLAMVCYIGVCSPPLSLPQASVFGCLGISFSGALPRAFSVPRESTMDSLV